MTALATTETTTTTTCSTRSTFLRTATRALGLLLLGTGALALPAGVAHASPPRILRAEGEILGGPARLVAGGNTLAIREGVLSGRLAGGAYDVRIGTDYARGTGPAGKIDVRITRAAGEGYEVTGVWNGGTIRLAVDPSSVKGRAVREVGGAHRGFGNCRYDISRVGSGLGAGGNFSGTADCLGSRPVRFELAPRTEASLSNVENVVLLVAYLAGPSPIDNY